MESQPSADGKQIEELVATIEGLLLPRGFAVTKNQRVYNDHGVQVAEFDVEIRGQLGSGDIAWLIECRNRPSEGPAPGSWIEQLCGRRSRFNFSKVTAVSTTGFAKGAAEYAAQVGIELRQIDQVAPEVASWLRLRFLISTETRHFLNKANFVLADHEPPERVQAAADLMKAKGDKPLDQLLLRSTQTGDKVSALQSFVNVVAEHPELWEDVLPNQTSKPVHLNVEYPLENSHFVIDTPVGPVRIIGIEFQGELSIIETEVPLEGLSEYRRPGTERPISQSAEFVVPLQGNKVSLELHRLVMSGETVMTVRQVVPSDGPMEY